MMSTSLNILEEENHNETWNYYKLKILEAKKEYNTYCKNEVSFACSFCYQVIEYLWQIVDYDNTFDLRDCKFQRIELYIETKKIAKQIAEFFSSLPVVECGYYSGNLYTLLLPESFKSKLGIYYTPPVLAERLLDLLILHGANFTKAKIIDPACGGGAFLVPIVSKILDENSIKSLSAESKLKYIENHVYGIEIDAFSGWLTQVFVDIAMYKEEKSAGRKIGGIVKIGDTLKYVLNNKSKYELIIGNPPFGKVKLESKMRQQYSRSLFGHANMYGLFIDAALRIKSQNGLVGFVAPTSFLGGEYFKNLRSLLSKEALPIAIDFISERSGVFDKVLQETCLVVFKNNESKETSINDIDVYDTGCKISDVGKFKFNLNNEPWIMPRHKSQVPVMSAVKDVKTTIEDYGYKASTGPLVWNRNKDQLRDVYEKGVHPIIWSEAINNGEFTYDYKIRKIKYIKLIENQDYLLCNKPVILIQRTTSKEQSRRILAALMPEDFINKWNGVVIENHVNMIYCVHEPKISLEGLTLILNTKIIDKIFRCISGSVAVSVSELHSLPLPPYEKICEIDNLIKEKGYSTKDELMNKVEKIVNYAYGIEV